MAWHDIKKSIGLYADYFHAVLLEDDADILDTTTPGSVPISYDEAFQPYDIVDKMIGPLTDIKVLRPDGNKLLVPLEGLLYLPDTVPPAGKFPLLIIAHGNHASYFNNEGTTEPVLDAEGRLVSKGVYVFNFKPDFQVESYLGYQALQNDLAAKGIASYSINLNIVNCLDNNEKKPFKRICLDVNQRILIFFLHLKLLKMIAGESLPVSPTDEFPIMISNDPGWTNLKAELENDTISTELRTIKNALAGQIDFTRLGLMGHSRGADSVARIPAYFFKGATPGEPRFHCHLKVKERITALVKQVGKPTQDFIKVILALEPVVPLNEEHAETHEQGYIIDEPQTMFFAAIGTHDEDVSFDPVRIYEYPACSKALIAIGGASHQRFNEVWASNLQEAKFDAKSLPSLLSLKEHQNILVEVFGRCFTATLGAVAGDWDFFDKKKNFPVTLSKAFNIQMSWKFGFPVQTNSATLNPLDPGIHGVPTSDPASHDYKFEQHLTAFFVEKTNEGNFIIKIPIDNSGSSGLSEYTHFSFRFARGFDLGSNPERTEIKNFTIQMFEGDSMLGKLIEGSQMNMIELKALRATPHQNLKKGEKLKFEYSFLLQTAEIVLEECFPENDQSRVNRIEITIVPDTTKAVPPSTGELVFGSAAGAIIGAGMGAGGSLIYTLAEDTEPSKRDKIMLWSSVAGTVAGACVAYLALRGDKDAFVFNDFLLTNRPNS